MCTLSWLLGQDSYHLLCNRDEKKCREHATPPAITQEENFSVLAPRDPQGGGTWLAANSMGISVALLNGNSEAPFNRIWKSRGILPERLIRLGRVERMMNLLEDTDLSSFLPFSLLAFDPLRPIQKFDWDGKAKQFSTDNSACGIATSSSFESEAVCRSRNSLFHRMKAATGSATTDLLYSFHESHGVQANSFSPCMHRPDAETVSFSWIRVDPMTVSLFYAPGAPCKWATGRTLEVLRVS